MACCARACVVASSRNQAPNICKSEELSCGGKGPPSLAAPADVIGGNSRVSDRDARLCRTGSLPCVCVPPHKDPRCSDCSPPIASFFPCTVHTQSEISPLLWSCVTATWHASDRQGLYCGFTACWPPSQPHTYTHSHTHTHAQPAHSHTAAGGRGPLADAHICRS